MTYSNDWTVVDNPADHSKFKDQPSFIRKIRTDIQERLADIFYGFTSGDTVVGLKQILMNNQADDPAAPVDAVVMFGKKAYVFTVSGVTIVPTAGATYTNNSKTFTVIYAAATKVYATGTGEPAASGTLTKASGTGDATIAFSAMTSKAELYMRHESAGVKILTDLGRVIGGALTGLDTIPAAAGVIPSANLPSSFPVGGIVMWSGTVATIPAGWVLCDGSNGTPDLRDRFVVGAKQDDAGVAKTNISGALTKSGGSVTIDITQMPSHTHTCWTALNSKGGRGGEHPEANTYIANGVTTATGGGLPYMQPYFALAFIMKT
jgi:hypothetical protein